MFDFIGLMSIIVFYITGHRFPYEATLPILLVGLFCIFYRGMVSLGIIYDKFMINIKLMKNSVIGMVPFLAVLGCQILLFSALNVVKALADSYERKGEGKEGH